jgi:small subunit ribosomal protein S16
MAVKIRMSRTGANNDISFRVVAADSRSPRDGNILEKLGWYDPKVEGLNFRLKLDRVDFWVSQGAEVSDAVAVLVRKARRAAKQAAAEAPAAEAPAAEAPVAEAPVAP